MSAGKKKVQGSIGHFFEDLVVTPRSGRSTSGRTRMTRAPQVSLGLAMIGVNHVTRATLAEQTEWQLKYRDKRKERRIVKLDIKFAPVIVFCSKRWLARRHSPAERRAPGPRRAKRKRNPKKRKLSARPRRDATLRRFRFLCRLRGNAGPPREVSAFFRQVCAPSKTILRFKAATSKHSTPCQNESIHLCFAKRPRLAQCS